MIVKQWHRYKEGWVIWRKFKVLNPKKIKFYKILASTFSKNSICSFATTIEK